MSPGLGLAAQDHTGGAGHSTEREEETAEGIWSP